MQVNPYLTFNGQCANALKFYEQLLGGKVTFTQTWGESPMCDSMPPEAQKLIMHSTLQLGESQLMCADSPSDHYQKPQGIHIALHFNDPKEGERIFNGLAEGGQIEMPFQATFWAAGFGMCVDRFGIPWMVNCGQAGGS